MNNTRGTSMSQQSMYLSRDTLPSKSTTMKRKTGESSSTGVRQSLEMEALVVGAGDFKSVLDKERIVLICGRIALTKRQLGIIGAVINGLSGGLNLIPLHYAQQEGFGGAAFLVSYACGSMIVNTCMWIMYWLYLLPQRRYSFRESFDSLPDFHLDKLWGPGFLAGSLYSVANFGSILSVTYLGQGVGFSLCQVQILVSGLWGIFFFKEIKGRDTITKWVISACFTVAGILMLTYQKAR
jgi:Transmembrane family, TMEM144 of transporters